jgi:hypothetical protein
MVTRAPAPGAFSATILPPAWSTNALETARPNPCPISLVVMNGSKMWGSTWSGIPPPVSVTSILTDAGVLCASTRTQCSSLLPGG